MEDSHFGVSRDPIDALLEQVCADDSDLRRSRLERIAAEHPAYAEELRARFELLEDAGMSLSMGVIHDGTKSIEVPAAGPSERDLGA